MTIESDNLKVNVIDKNSPDYHDLTLHCRCGKEFYIDLNGWKMESFGLLRFTCECGEIKDLGATTITLRSKK